MALIKPSEPWCQTAEQTARRHSFGRAARSELALRHALEAFCRSRWPAARICHEMVMGERRVRADVVAIDVAHITAFEVKGSYDDMTRMLHQVGLYQLCVPEVWMVVAQGHASDAKLIRHLLPSVGLLTGRGTSRRYDYEFDAARDCDEPFGLTVEAESAPRPVVPEMMLEMMWHAELSAMCSALRVSTSKRPTRGAMIKNLLELSTEELQRACCTELRGRDALWRADAPIRGYDGSQTRS